ncbi:MAG: aromatic-ring-hydroxylating dioxygenase subunit beta [Rhodospirillales bacterium]|jgi:benzoate/toluate 1,2-dioxygenase beta subunit
MSLTQEVSSFLTHEADFLDRGDFEAWLELYEDDALYWIPSSPDQTDMKGQVSIMLEDRPLLKLRVRRLSHPRAYAVTPRPATIHLIGNVSAREEGDLVMVSSKLIMTQVRDNIETSLSGVVSHHLSRSENGFGIKLKRVDLIQAGGTFSAISVPL